jgi:ParB-like chromosome segregation protein Spo0J
MPADIKVAVETVAISTLRPHPLNARRGDVDTISESLATHGQYRPVVASRRTNHILGGHHVIKAAKKLGWRTIAVTWVDVDADGERAILLADNRTSDLATYNDSALLGLLESLPDLTGTGFTQADLDSLTSFDTSGPTGDGSTSSPVDTDPKVRVGQWRFSVAKDAYTPWADEILVQVEGKRSVVARHLRGLLGIPEPVAKPITPVANTEAVTETVDIDSVKPYPANARQGDVGAIVESLAVHGQYRPIVVNRRDDTILIGNHTWRAAKGLGWDRIAVAWVDVDEVQAAKIVVVDNRTSDLATYDTDGLRDLLREVGNLSGTGYLPEDVADILDGGSGRPGPGPAGRTTIKIGDWGMRVTAEVFNPWARDVDGPRDIAQRLGLPMDSCDFGEDF